MAGTEECKMDSTEHESETKNVNSTGEHKMDKTEQENESKKVSKENVSSANNSNGSDILSKRQKKKLLKRKAWLDKKEERKKQQKEKRKIQIEAKRAAGTLCCKGTLRKRLKGVTMAGSSCKQRIAVDMSFDNLMVENRLIKCVKQLSRCYSANRRVTDPAQFYITDFQGKCQDAMAKQDGYMHWDVHFKTENYLDVFDKEEIIYLTSESDNVLTNLDVTKVYIIGGLVDYNVHKGLCHKLALEKGLKHARLPINEFIEMKARKVLTIDQVFKILLNVSQGKPWKDSILETIPPRKGAVAKGDVSDEEESKE